MKAILRLTLWIFISCWVVAHATACSDAIDAQSDETRDAVRWQFIEAHSGTSNSPALVLSVVQLYVAQAVDNSTCAEKGNSISLDAQQHALWLPILQHYLADPFSAEKDLANTAYSTLTETVSLASMSPSEAVLAAITAELLFNTYQFELATDVLTRFPPSAMPQALAPVMTLLKGKIYLRQRENTEAIQIFKSLVNDDSLSVVVQFKAGVLLGEAYLDDNQVNAGRLALSNSEALLEGPDGHLLANDDVITLYDNVGFLYIKLAQQTPETADYNLSEALRYERKALAAAEKDNNIKQQITIHSNIAWLQSRRQDFNASQYHLLTLLVLLQSHEDPDLEAFTYQNVSTVYFRLGEYNKAAAYLHGAIERVADNAPKVKAELQCRLAQSLMRSGVTTSAAPLVRACYEGLMTGTVYEKQAIALVASLEAADLGIATPVAADALTEQLKQLVNEDIDVSLKTEAVLKLADIAYQRGAINEAADWLASLSDEQVQVTSLLAVKVRKRQYEILLKRGDAESDAYAEATHAMIISQLRAMSGNDMSAAWRHSVNDFYTLWLAQLMKKNTPASNAYLAGNLLLLNELNIRQQPFSLDATRQQRLNALNTQRFDSGVAPLAVRLQQLLEVDLLRHASMYASKTQTSMQVNEVTAGGMSHTLCDIQDCLAQVQASLGAGERVVLYVPAEQHIRAVVISADTVTLHAIAPLQTLVALAEEAALSVMQRRQDAERRLQTLAEQLFAPMLTEDSASTWIVAGHVPVNTVSLNALVASLPSPPAAFKRVMSSTRTVQNQNMASDSAAIRVLATQQINAQSGELAALDALPWAKVEAEQIQAAFAPQPIDVLLNNAATDEALFSEDTRQANILHIAAHNIYDPTEPDVVGLALNQASANGTGGTLIDIRAIEHSGFANNLVFLNACDTANGRDFDGVGSLSLARAFLQSGAQTVVATKWPIVDRASGMFAAHFYRAIQSGSNAEQALNLAIAGMQSSRRYKHPYYWAGYELTQRHL